MFHKRTPARRDRMDRAAASRVYDQYWQHARHVENQLHSFVGFYVLITGSALALSASIGEVGSVAAASFVFLLSLLGLFFNYNLRVPFIKFTLIAELIAINEFGLKGEYRRFFDPMGRLVRDKRIDTYDVFAALFMLGTVLSVAGVVFFSIEAAGGLSFAVEAAMVIGLASAIGLLSLCIYLWTVAQLKEIKRDIVQRGTEGAPPS